MIIGVPKEIKEEEYRVGIVPAGVRMLTGKGHRVLIQRTLARAVESRTTSIGKRAPKSWNRPKICT